MQTLIHAISAVSVAVLLAACGGGGDGSADPAAATSATATTTTTTTGTTTTAAKYAGTWGGCFATGAATSRKETLVITPQGATLDQGPRRLPYSPSGVTVTPLALRLVAPYSI